MPQRKTRRTASGMGNIRKRTFKKNGKEYTLWEARYTVGNDPLTGKQIQRSFSGKTQKEVKDRLKQVILELEQETYVEPCKLTVGEWLDTWLKEYLTNVKVMTQQNYTIGVNAHIKPALGSCKLDALDTHSIQRFYNSLRTERNLSPKSIKNIHGILHCALQQAIDNGYISRNPTEACKLPKVIRPEINPLEPQEIARLLQEAQKDDYCNLFTVALFTGMRQSELIGLT